MSTTVPAVIGFLIVVSCCFAVVHLCSWFVGLVQAMATLVAVSASFPADGFFLDSGVLILLILPRVLVGRLSLRWVLASAFFFSPLSLRWRRSLRIILVSG